MAKLCLVSIAISKWLNASLLFGSGWSGFAPNMKLWSWVCDAWLKGHVDHGLCSDQSGSLENGATDVQLQFVFESIESICVWCFARRQASMSRAWRRRTSRSSTSLGQPVHLSHSCFHPESDVCFCLVCIMRFCYMHFHLLKTACLIMNKARCLYMCTFT